MQLKASAPGSLMLLGEYAVLSGKPALVCAVDKRLHVHLTERHDEEVNIVSEILGEHSTTLSNLQVIAPFQFILGVLKHFQGRIKRGFDIHVTSEFSDQVGLGSSAAITVATMAALVSATNIRMSPQDLVRQARNVIRQIQGVGSGADIAAAVHGGIVNYQAQPLSSEKLNIMTPLTVIYSGHKTKTVDAIKHVQTTFSANSLLLRSIYNSIGQCVLDGLHALRKQDWHKLGKLMNVQQGMLESLGVSTPLLQDILVALRNQPGIHGAKISGSGMGDCVIALGELPSHYTYQGEPDGIRRIPVAISLQGVQCEKI